MTKWQIIRMGYAYDISSGLSKSSEYFGKGHPFLSFKTIFNNYFIPESVNDLVESTELEQMKYSVNKDDVFLTRTSETVSELGMSSVALRDYPLMTFNGFTKRLRNNKKYEIDGRYIGYYLRSKFFRDNVTALSSMTTRASLNESMIHDLPLLLPPIDEQRKIGSILYSIDKKITLNSLVNDYLFKILRTKYLELISSECVVKTLNEISDIESGKRPSFIADSQSNDARIPVIGAAKIMGYTSDSMYSERMLVTGRVGTHGVIQRYWKEIWPSDNTLTIKTDHYEFVYQVLKDIDYSAINRGSTQPLITQSDLKNTEIWWPDSSKLEEYEDFVKPITTMIEKNTEQSVKLAAMRDVLLPKLMSGEIDVSKLELNS